MKEVDGNCCRGLQEAGPEEPQPAVVSSDDGIGSVRPDQELGQHQTHCGQSALSDAFAQRKLAVQCMHYCLWF